MKSIYIYIYIYKVEKNKRPNSILMKMFIKAKFICSYAGCGKSYPWEKIHCHKMFEFLYQSILCPAQGCKFINNVETEIYHFINCPFHFLYCGFCKSLCNMSVSTQNLNVIISQRSIFYFFSNIITRIRQPITFITMHFSIIIQRQTLKTEEKLTMICS